MGPLQRGVYWRLCLSFFFTAFVFFLDILTVTITSCREPNWTENDSLSTQIDVSQEMNESVWNNATGNNTIWCAEKGSFDYGQTAFMTGLLIGSLFGGALSDKYGRKHVLLGSNVLQAVMSLMMAFLPHTLFHLVVRCVVGITYCCVGYSSNSLGVEWSHPKHRVWSPALLSVAFSLGIMCLAAMAYLTSTWMQFHLALAIPQILCLPFYLSIPESPRWLLLNKRMKLLDEYRNKGVKDKESLDVILGTAENIQCSSKDQTRDDGHSSSHFKSHTILLRLSVMSFIGFTSALTYHGICFNVGNFGVNIHLALFFSGLSELPAVLVPLLLARCGRRPFCIISLVTSGIACQLSLLASWFCDIPGLIMALALMGKLCINTAVIIWVLYVMELFPTVIRQRCLGLTGLWYRFGSLLNSAIMPGDRIPLTAMICYSTGPILGAGLCLLLPETSGSPLPDTVEDCERQPGSVLQCASFHRRRRCKPPQGGAASEA